MATKKRNISAKKQGISSAQPRSYSDLYKDDKARTVQTYNAPAKNASAKRAVAVQEAAAPAPVVNWRVEYAHVIRDVRTLLLVSGVLFAIIIIIGFFV